MIYCWRCANQPLVWQQLWVWSHSLSVLNKFYGYSLVNNMGFPQTAISKPMTSPAPWIITVPSSTILRRALWSFGEIFQFSVWQVETQGDLCCTLFFEPKMRAFSNSSIAQIPEPNNTLLFLLVLWPRYHPGKLGIMLLLRSSPMMENTVSLVIVTILHKTMNDIIVILGMS